MSTVFISGSRNIRSLNQVIKDRLNNILDKHLSVIIGDANGIDKAVQSFFYDKKYPTVEIYCSGDKCRNNLGKWHTHYIPTNNKGRAFYEAKDKKMAEIADYGFVIWDGKSIGSLNNIAELISQGKPSLLFYIPNESFINIKNINNLKELLHLNEPELNSVINEKGSIYLKKLINNQSSLF